MAGGVAVSCEGGPLGSVMLPLEWTDRGLSRLRRRCVWRRWASWPRWCRRCVRAGPVLATVGWTPRHPRGEVALARARGVPAVVAPGVSGRVLGSGRSPVRRSCDLHVNGQQIRAGGQVNSVRMNHPGQPGRCGWSTDGGQRPRRATPDAMDDVSMDVTPCPTGGWDVWGVSVVGGYGCPLPRRGMAPRPHPGPQVCVTPLMPDRDTTCGGHGWTGPVQVPRKGTRFRYQISLRNVLGSARASSGL
jgi:hypothetical protein